jgi:hypothetical protein
LNHYLLLGSKKWASTTVSLWRPRRYFFKGFAHDFSIKTEISYRLTCLLRFIKIDVVVSYIVFIEFKLKTRQSYAAVIEN